MKSLSESVSARNIPVREWLSEPPRLVEGYDYLTGLRGLFTIQSFLWVFLTTFVPTAVKDSQNADGPGYQVFLRKILSVLFWNDGLIYSGIILLSARTVCLPFLKTSSVQTLASTLFRRSANLLLPVAVSLAVIALTFSQTGTEYIYNYTIATGNKSISIPQSISNAIIYFNSLFLLFWTTNSYTSQAASLEFPSGLLWVLSVVYQQSYTVYMTVLIIPYTRPAWRLLAFPLFIITAFWVQSWAWYSITGLMLADLVHNMDFKTKSARGIKIYRSIRLPSWILYVVLMAAGLAMQYLWVAWRPNFENYELQGHTGLYYTGGLNTDYDLKQPQARDDNYLILLGFFLILETSSIFQWIFSNRLFMFLGKRSYSYFLTQSIILYTIGIKLFTHLHINKSVSFPGAALAVFFTCVVATAASAEIMHRFVEIPGRKGAHLFWKWMRE